MTQFDIDRRVLDAMLRLQEDGPERRYLGICHNMVCILGEYRDSDKGVLNEAFLSWEHYSGNPDYPVPNTGNWEYDSGCFDNAGDLWDTDAGGWQGEYAVLRHDLLRHCIEVLKERVHGAGYANKDT